MGRSMRIAALGLAAALAALPAAALTLEEAIEKHVQAKGGRAAWKGIQALRVTGEFTAFSLTKPFVLQRTSAGQYHLDHWLGDKQVIVAHDGKTAWQDNPWQGAGAQLVRGADLAVLTRELDLKTPFFDHEEKDHQLKWLGEVEIDGIPALGIEVKRADELREVWYLDTGTFLELARDSPASDFGRPLEQRTWFEDFRSVGGVMIPHLSDTQWYTRDRVMRIASVVINPEVDAEIFRMPPPVGMGPLQPLVGRWEVELETRQGPDAPWTPGKRSSTIEPLLRGALLQERFTTAEGSEVVRSFTYDQYRKKYRVTEIDDQTTMLNVDEGELADGRLVVSNMTTNTPSEMFGMKIHERFSVFEIDADAFKVEVEVSTDGGTSWMLVGRGTYRRAG